MAGEHEGDQREETAVLGQRRFPLSSFSWQDTEKENMKRRHHGVLGGSCPGLGPAEWLSRRRRLPDYSFLLQSQRGFLKDVCFPPSSFFFSSFFSKNKCQLREN